jgi:hypothetical protein
MVVELDKVSYEVLSVSGGQVRDRVPNASVYQPSSRLGRRPVRDPIYMLMDLEGEARPDLVRDVLATLEEEYQKHPSRSVTSALVGAIRAANECLYQENLATVLTGRAVASISCVVIRGQDVYVGWAGQAPVYVLHEGSLRRVPAEPEPADDVNLLGLDDSIEVRLFHNPLAPGDVVLLCSASLEQMTTPGQLRGTLSQASVAAIRAQLIALAGEGDLTTVTIRVKEAPVAVSAPQPTQRRPGPLGVFKGLRPRRKRPAPPRATPEPRPTRADRPPIPAERPARIPPPGVRVTDRRPAAAPTRRVPWLLVLLPIVVVILAALVLGWFALSQWQENQAREAYFANLLTRAEQLHTQAQGEPDRSARVQTLRQARSLVDEALTMKPGHKETTKLGLAIEQDLDRASLVTRFYGPILLTEFETEGSQATQLWVQGNRVYVLDAGRGILYRYFLNENRDGLLPQDDPALLRVGQTVGDRVVESLQFIFWMPAGGDRQEGILALDLNAHLFGEAGADQRAAYDVGDSQQWGRVVAGGGYAGNLYLLDAGKSQIYKYLPSAAGYPGPVTDYLQTPVDLSTGVDMAIDGHIYVLQANGEVIKLLRGEKQPFPMTGLDVPLKDPRAIFCTEAVASVYVVDAGEQRIVQFSKEGTFQRQFRYGGQEEPDLFADLRDVSVAEGETLARVYVLARNRLVVFPLPPLEEPLELPRGE